MLSEEVAVLHEKTAKCQAKRQRGCTQSSSAGRPSAFHNEKHVQPGHFGPVSQELLRSIVLSDTDCHVIAESMF